MQRTWWAGGLAAATAILAVMAAAPQARQQAAAPGRPTKLALVGGMLLDGYEAGAIHHAAILIDGERIVKVGRAAEMTIPSDYTIVDTAAAR